jgi:hypothetical protein
MALESELFRDDQRLQACAVDNAAHLTPGAVGPPVAKVQIALALVDEAEIDAGELAATRYGPSTAAAVLDFKTARSIINFSYQTQADNIVGKMTIAALDREMAAFERKSHASPLCHCRDFPRSREDAAPRRRFFVAFAIPTGAVGAALTGTPKEQALARLPGAKLWVRKAREFIFTGIAQLLSGQPINDFADTEARKALVTHFKIDQAPHPVPHLDSLERIYGLIGSTLAKADTIFLSDPSTTDFGNAHLGGFFHLDDPVLGKIRFGPNYAGKGELFQTGVIVHEGAHFVSPVIDHFASELPAPLGTPVNSSTGIAHTKNYADLSFQEAAQNAYTFAQFALHAFKGFDKRIVPFDE